jgi:hypothetical protein
MRIVDPPDPRVFESWTPFEDFFYTDHHGSIVPDIEKIKSLGNLYDFVIANCSTEHWGSQRDYPIVARLHDLLTEHYAKDFVCLCHDPSDEALRPRIMYFPFFAWRKRWPLPDPMLVANINRTYLFSNLNHFARDFRIANWLVLQQKPYAGKCLITMHNIVQEQHAYDNNFALTSEEKLAWLERRPELPCKVSDGFGMFFDSKHPAFADTYLHIVSETTCKDKIFLTEKTWQTIHAGQLFMVWGNSGIIAHLRDLGVDVFDDIVNHEYDAVIDHRKRFKCMHEELDRLSVLDWADIYRSTAKRRQTNADKFHTGVFISDHMHRLKSRLPKGII